MKTFYKRQLTLILSLMLLFFALLSSSFILLSYRHIITEKKDSMLHNAQYVADFTGSYLEQGNIEDGYFRLYIASLARISEAHVMMAEMDGRVVYSTDGTRHYAHLQRIPDPLVESVRQRGRYMGMNDLNGIFSDKRFLAAVPVMARSGQTQVMRGLVLVSTGAEGISEMWRDMAKLFFFTALSVLIIAVIASSITSAYQVRPINEIADAARRFGHGDFSVRTRGHEKRRDEVGALAEAFNHMADSLERSETQRNEFIANVSHELKTPMTTIAGFADGILDGTIPPERERESLQVISSETRRLSRLVRQMLDLSRLQAAGERMKAQEQFDLSEVLLRVLVSLEGRITQRDLDVETQIPDRKILVWGDPDSITQVCYNLLDNAAKFAQPDSTILVRITTRENKALVTVQNRGETIPEQELPRLFDRFHKADQSRSRDRDGVGLGLYIVKTILGNMKETITVTSRDGVTEFTFTLTLA